MPALRLLVALLWLGLMRTRSARADRFRAGDILLTLVPVAQGSPNVPKLRIDSNLPLNTAEL